MQFVRAVHFAAVLGFAWASSLSAQHATGRSGVAGPGFVPRAQRGASSSLPQSTGPNLGGRPYPIRTDIPTPLGLNAPAASYTGILPGALTPSPGSRGSRYFPGFIAPPVYLPTYVDTGFSSFPSFNESAPPPVDPNAQALTDSQNALAQQIQQLTMEIREMKGGSPQPQPPPPSVSAPPVNAVPEHRPPTPPVTLVLRDGQQITVDNYAVMNQTFWNLSKRPVQKIPIANIDIPASTRATEANGGEFPQLASAR